MSEERTVTSAPARRGTSGVTGAIILIAIGVVFLVNNLGWLSIDWLSLLRFWPVVLVLIGLDIILGRQSVFGSLAVAAIAVVVLGGIIYLVGVGKAVPTAAAGPIRTQNIAQALGDVQALEVNLNLGVSEARLEALSDNSNAAQGTYRANTALPLETDYHARGTTGVLTLTQHSNQRVNNYPSNFIAELQLGITDQVPVDLTVNAGVGEATLDLSGINLHSLTIKAGVGHVTVILPDQGSFTVSIDAGVGQVDLTVPLSLEARIGYDGGLSNLDVPARFDKTGDHTWETAGYSNAENRATISINSGIGEVNVHD